MTLEEREKLTNYFQIFLKVKFSGSSAFALTSSKREREAEGCPFWPKK
jgi:hypothetical protein